MLVRITHCDLAMTLPQRMPYIARQCALWQKQVPRFCSLPFKKCANLELVRSVCGTNDSVQLTTTLARLLPALVPGCQASAHLRIRRPPLALTYAAICANPRSVYVLEAIGSPLRLKGQMLPQPASRHLLFLCSPAVTDVAALAAVGLSLSDFAIHDRSEEHTS